MSQHRMSQTALMETNNWYYLEEEDLGIEDIFSFSSFVRPTDQIPKIFSLQ